MTTIKAFPTPFSYIDGDWPGYRRVKDAHGHTILACVENPLAEMIVRSVNAAHHHDIVGDLEAVICRLELLKGNPVADQALGYARSALDAFR